MAPRLRLLITSEHAGNRVPSEYRRLFAGHEALLASHRGFDPGTRTLARTLARRLGCPLHEQLVTRLLVDANRSPHNPRIFSSLTRQLPTAERAALLERYHAPHWRAVEASIRRLAARGDHVLHVGVHSFTPVLDGTVRTMDLALLYDPGRRPEASIAHRWLTDLRAALPWLTIRANAPYRGVADGLPTALRRRFPAARYSGLELEVNQRFFLTDHDEWPEIGRAIRDTLDALVLDGGVTRPAHRRRPEDGPARGRGRGRRDPGRARSGR